MKKTNMTKIKETEHFQTGIHTFCLFMPIGDFRHHTLYNVWFKSPEKSTWRKLKKERKERKENDLEIFKNFIFF